MKKPIILCVAACALLLAGCAEAAPPAPGGSYDSVAAVAYARRYAEARNDEYGWLDMNCTNFVSQCLVAGGMEMNEGKRPSERERIVYDDDEGLWYSYGAQFSPERPPHYASSLPFIRTGSFVAYWTGVRGHTLTRYDNTFVGRDGLLREAAPGDIFLLYDDEGEVSHIGILTEVAGDDALFCANSKDMLDYSVCGINAEKYPIFGIITMKE